MSKAGLRNPFFSAMVALLALLALVGGGAATTVTQSPYALGWKLSATAVKSTQMVDLTIIVQVRDRRTRTCFTLFFYTAS